MKRFIQALKKLYKQFRLLGRAVHFEYNISNYRSTTSTFQPYLFRQWDFVSIGLDNAWFESGIWRYDGIVIKTITILGIEFAYGSVYDRVYEFTNEEWLAAN